jgi:hypothetical protein
MTDRYKGFLVTLDKEIRTDDAEHILTALKMIKGVQIVKPYINKGEDWMMYEKGYMDARIEIFELMRKKVNPPKDS